MKAVIYARISQDRQGDQLGVTRQLSDCRGLVSSRGWTVVGEFVDDDVSAYGGKVRPGYEAMMQAVRAGGVGAVVVWDLDRLTRRPIELEQFVIDCERAGMGVLESVHGSFDLANGSGLMHARLKAVFAAEESKTKSVRAKRKMLELAEAGMPHGGGSRQYGYQADRVTVDQTEAAVVADLAARVLAGESLTSVARWLNASGIVTVQGRHWRVGTVRTLLLEPRIAGLRVHQGEVIGKAVWPPIITEEQHAQLVALLTDPARRAGRTPRRYLLAGLARCGKCGTRMIANPRKEVRRYVCAAGPNTQGCGGVSMNAEPVEEYVSEAVLMRLDSEELREALAGLSRSDQATAALSEAIATDEARLDELASAYAEHLIDLKSWIKAGDKLRANIEAKRRELSHRSGSQVLTSYLGAGSPLRQRWGVLGLDQQQAIIKTIVDAVVINPAKQRGPHLPDLSRIDVRWLL